MSNAGDTLQFNCDHAGTVPANIGRGMARQKRIQEYFGRSCCACAIAKYIALVDSLTDGHGNPLPQEVRQRKITKRSEYIAKYY